MEQGWSEALPEVAGIGVRLMKLLARRVASELVTHSAEPDEPGVALAVQRHAHAPHDRIPGVVKLALARRRARVDHLVLLVLTLEVRTSDVEPVPTATEEHRAGDGGLYRCCSRAAALNKHISSLVFNTS